MMLGVFAAEGFVQQLQVVIVKAQLQLCSNPLAKIFRRMKGKRQKSRAQE
jgi:hypothetical protein